MEFLILGAAVGVMAGFFFGLRFASRQVDSSRAVFETLAQKIFDEKSKTLAEQSEKNVSQLLEPVRQSLKHFTNSVEMKYADETKERASLKSEIERLIKTNERMTLGAESLAKALKGDTKVQGDWGELVLSKVLDAAGLREGVEYTVQDQHLSHEGDRFRPDVLVQLPEEKHIIIDSKVSLTAYEKFRNSEIESERTAAMAEHVRSVERHVEDLASKHYPRLKGLKSPDFVLMFIPLEGAYLTAMQARPEIAQKAWAKGVAIVTTTTLFTSLKTIASVWRLEKQNRNAMKIAEEGARMYDKFVGFLEDFEKIGQNYETGSKLYQSAMGKLKEGPGNVFRKMEVLKELGSAPSKKIASQHLDEASS